MYEKNVSPDKFHTFNYFFRTQQKRTHANVHGKRQHTVKKIPAMGLPLTVRELPL